PLRSAGSDGSFRTWNTTSAQLVATATVGKGPVGWAAWSPDGKLVVAAPANVAIVAESAPPFREIARCTGHTAAVSYVAFDATGEHVVSLDKHENEVASAVFSPDGGRIVTTTGGGDVRVWETASGRLIGRLAGHQGIVFRSAFSPDGELLATSGDDGTVRWWNLHLEERGPEAIARYVRCHIPMRLVGGKLLGSPIDPSACEERDVHVMHN